MVAFFFVLFALLDVGGVFKGFGGLCKVFKVLWGY